MGEEAREGFLKEVALGLALEDEISVGRGEFGLKSLFRGHSVEAPAMAQDGGTRTSPSQCSDGAPLRLAHSPSPSPWQQLDLSFSPWSGLL